MPPKNAIPKREDLPPKFLAFLREQLTRGAKRVHLQHRTMGPATPVEDWPVPPGTKADELAETIWRRALEDAEQSGDGGLARYGVVVIRAEGDPARWTITTPALTGFDGGAHEGPNAEGIIAQSMKHLREERAVTSTVLLESIEALHGTHADQLVAWKKCIEGYAELADKSAAVLSRQVEFYEKANERLLATNERMADKHLELIVVLEDLKSDQHTRDLELEKMRRSEGRKSQLIDELVIKRVVPALAAKFGAGIGIGISGAPTPAAGEDTRTDELPTPSFTPRQSRAIGAFLRVLGGPDLVAIDAALTGEPKQRFKELVEIFIEETENAHAAAAAANAANANGKGASPS